MNEGGLPSFSGNLAAHGLGPLRRGETRTLQINVGRRCNQACHHCHVDAGPERREAMNHRTADRVVGLLDEYPGIAVLDITGGAPELNPDFRFLVEQARRRGRRVIDRCNLTVLFEPGQHDTAAFLADHEVAVVASLPCYSKANVEQQRGRGVFDKSIEALRELNRLGYGQRGSSLRLDLVYNPLGPYLPPAQKELEEQYRRELDGLFGIAFNRLLTITNMPIKRFAHQLAREGKDAAYLSLLVSHFNPATVSELMCRTLVSVDYEGRLYDCDFNQMLEIPLGERPRSIWDERVLDSLLGEPVATASHCFGCTAGTGSSCGGSLA